MAQRYRPDDEYNAFEKMEDWIWQDETKRKPFPKRKFKKRKKEVI